MKKTIILVVGILFAIIAGWLLYSSMTFRITGTTPSLNRVSNISPFIDVHFSKEITLDNADIDSDELGITGFDKVDEKTIRVYFGDITVGTRYTVTINHVESTDGKLIEQKNLSFTAKDIPFEKLSAAQRQAILDYQDKTNNIKSDPVLSYVPYGGLHFQLDANSDSGLLTLVAELRLSAADVKIDREKAIETYKKEVLDYLSGNGIDPSKYQIEYKIAEPSIY